MNNMTSQMGGFILPVLVIAVALAFVLAVRFIASRYKKIPPNKVGVFYGRKYKAPGTGDVQGYLVVTGGGRVQLPLVEDYMEMPTSAFQIEIDEKGIPNRDNVRLTVRGVASVQLSSLPEDLNRAAQSFLGKSETEIKVFIGNILQGHLRSIIGQMTIDEILRERDKFNQRVIAESSQELKRVGMDVINLVIKDANDDQGYIDALGRRAVAEAKAEAEIKVAEATRQQSIAVSNAQQESALVKASNEAKIAEAEKERDIKKAAFLRETATVQAEANMAGAIAQAAQEKTLKVAEADRDAAEKEAQVKVQEKEATRMAAQLRATTVATAEAAKQTAILNAEAEKQRRIIGAQAEAEALRTTAEAKKNAAVLEGQGEAEASKAKLLALAEGKAAEKKQALLAEAEGTQALATALAQMSTDARFILILDKLPNLMDHGGDAGAKLLQAIFGPAAAALAQIERISIVDVGGNGNGIAKVSGMVPQAVLQILSQLEAYGIDVKGLLKLLKIDTTGLESLLAGIQPKPPATTQETPARRETVTPPPTAAVPTVPTAAAVALVAPPAVEEKPAT
jgi:flotillin